MTKEEALEKMKAVPELMDTEYEHAAADRILCDLLISLGCAKVVEEFEKLEKWYA